MKITLSWLASFVPASLQLYPLVFLCQTIKSKKRNAECLPLFLHAISHLSSDQNNQPRIPTTSPRNER